MGADLRIPLTIFMNIASNLVSIECNPMQTLKVWPLGAESGLLNGMLVSTTLNAIDCRLRAWYLMAESLRDGHGTAIC